MRFTLHQNPPKITVFRQISEDAAGKIFLIKECIDILLPLITKLVNYLLIEGCIPDAFKTAVVTALIKKAYLPSDDLKNYHPGSGLSVISKLVVD